MRFSCPKAVFAAALMLVCQGCSTFYIIDNYRTVPLTLVKLECDDAYDVYDRVSAGVMMVSSDAILETVHGVCTVLGRESDSQRQRLRKVADAYFAQVLRPECKVTGETRLSLTQFEFKYACPKPPPVPVAVVAPVTAKRK